MEGRRASISFLSVACAEKRERERVERETGPASSLEQHTKRERESDGHGIGEKREGGLCCVVAFVFSTIYKSL